MLIVFIQSPYILSFIYYGNWQHHMRKKYNASNMYGDVKAF